jgi:acyl-CoA synthetase (AMP-forming)/AMP-acid ligase II
MYTIFSLICDAFLSIQKLFVTALKPDEMVLSKPTAETVTTVNQLLAFQASKTPHAPCISYSTKGGTQYFDYSFAQIHRVSKHLSLQYKKTYNLSNDSPNEKVVAILGVSNLQYIVSVLALSRLRLTVLLLSTRITDAAYSHLLRTTGCKTVLVQPSFERTISRVKTIHTEDINVFLLPELPIEVLDEESSPEEDTEDIPESEADRAVWIIHSSGSTGLPKPLRHTHRYVINSASGMARGKEGLPVYTCLPFNHTYGSLSTIAAVVAGACITLHNADLPLTTRNVVEAFRYRTPGIVHIVPYVIKLLSSDEEGIEGLKQCKEVGYAGAACPEALGDELVERGVNLVNFYGR